MAELGPRRSGRSAGSSDRIAGEDDGSFFASDRRVSPDSERLSSTTADPPAAPLTGGLDVSLFQHTTSIHEQYSISFNKLRLLINPSKGIMGLLCSKRLEGIVK